MRTASDRGITASTIKVGFAILNLGGLDQAGFAVGLRTDIPAVVDALVDAANKRGGINGRMIVADKAKVDGLSQSDQRAKCLQMIETDKVFGVLDATAFLNKATQACITIEHKTPFVHSNAMSAQFMRDGYPYDVSPNPDQNRVMKDWVASAKAAGLFDPAKGFGKLGVLVDDCVPETIDDAAVGLRALLRQAGVGNNLVSEFRLPCDVGQAQQQVPLAVQQHKSDGVTLVFPGTIFTSVQTYLQQADTQLFHPRYYASDFWGLTRDTVSKNFKASQWDRSQAMTVSRSGELAAGKPLSPESQACSKDLTDRGVPGITDYDTDLEALLLCENLDLFIRIGANAGPNPTRASWGQAIKTVGRFRPAAEDLAVFDRDGKVSGGDTIARVEWRKECTCWHQITGFGPAYG